MFYYSLGTPLERVFQRLLTLIFLQKYRDTNGRRIVIQIGGVYSTVCQLEGILLQKYRDRNGRCIAILFKSIGVRGRFEKPCKIGIKIQVCQIDPCLPPHRGSFPKDFLRLVLGNNLARQKKKNSKIKKNPASYRDSKPRVPKLLEKNKKITPRAPTPNSLKILKKILQIPEK